MFRKYAFIAGALAALVLPLAPASAQTALKWAHVYETSEPFHTESVWAAEEIAKRLEKFLPSPVVNLSVVRVGSHRIYVIGRVQKPGDFPAGRYIDVLQILTMAGGLTPFANENRIQIIRREAGKQVIIPFKFGEVRRGVNMDQNLILRAGDTVMVP